jgi:CheY-like chemotaxis protein
VELLRPTLPAGVEVDASGLQGTGASVLADAGQLEQAVFNLCINARDALGRSGHLRVRSGQGPAREPHCASCSAPLSAGAWCWIEVADDGPGFPVEVVGRMFEPFFTTKEVGLGTGLGLAMVHGIVHDHGGHVEVSAAPGRGACFRVLLPLSAPPDHAASARQSTSGAARERRPLKGRVLVVEDETLVGDFLHEQLADWGLDAVLERDPRLALDRLRRRERFDLLLTDLTMPNLSGLELAAAAHRLHPALPVLLCTGDGTGLTEGDLSRCGVSSLLAKPVDPACLRRLLEQLVGAAAT